ncbi:hypothetical protein [Nitrospira lenta]|uniref:Uncharacterized protein n=1 Tax=Nitrospira lenta TaxID=1436998 RepID=A0A330L381_9BACT|nr:hypothetical protein [Nitrospira lenta]SPP63649.1 hypothetical protein NITLEN_10735 [Nitrospira lenta]
MPMYLKPAAKPCHQNVSTPVPWTPLRVDGSRAGHLLFRVLPLLFAGLVADGTGEMVGRFVGAGMP